ncbi:MAG: DUF6145 family protein [Lachnospiraceae bacterium]|nr:DUF6145 family protein [Lachnospiraceae bacterium]
MANLSSDNILDDGRIVLCGASAYEEKYFFNRDFAKLPENIQEELHVICVLYTQEAGGIFLMVFDEEGNLNLETRSDEDDMLYDEVTAGLLIGEIRRKRKELFAQIEMFYRVFILGETVE